MGGSFFDAAIAREAKRSYERGVQQGIEHGAEQTRLFYARRLMKEEGWSFDRAMSFSDVPREQWKNYAEQMEQTEQIPT